MTINDVDRTVRIRQLNDALRVNGSGGRVVMTAGVAGLSPAEQAALVAAVRAFSAFHPDNDPSGERDCAIVQVGEHSIIWKIEYYDLQFEAHSPDPADPTCTCRVLTIMLSVEY